MGIIGIVSEYNPFHKGHEYHINKSRQMLGEDPGIICVMSGDFVQRGEAAVYSKFARAEAACRCGADLVIELPLPWALSSAEGFARGAVGLLDALGVTHISFGSECGDVNALETVAQHLLDPTLTNEIKMFMGKEPNISYPAARQKILQNRAGDLAAYLEQPNNILAIEYIKAVYDLGSNMKPVTVQRYGSGHDQIGSVGPKSASELRSMILDGKAISGCIPEAAAEVFLREQQQGRELNSRNGVELAILSRLRMFSEEYFNELPDALDGLGTRIYKAVQEETNIDKICAAAKTKRYTMARIRRICMCACLGIKNGMNSGIPPYARVLAANEKGCEILRKQSGCAKLPVVVKPASVREINQESLDLFAIGASAHDFYSLFYPAMTERKAGQDWKTSPKIVKDV